MFAVIKTGGKQYRVVAEDILQIDRVDAEPGSVIEFGEVLVVGGETPVLGLPTVEGATVAAEVLDHVRGPKVIAFKKRRTEILTEGKKPSPTPPPRPKRAPKEEAAPTGEGDASNAA
jgi:large subunit ribosomal protein L21